MDEPQHVRVALLQAMQHVVWTLVGFAAKKPNSRPTDGPVVAITTGIIATLGIVYF